MTDETAKQAQQTVLSERLAVLKKNKAFIVGVSILGFWVFSAIFGKLIARYDQDFMDYEYINSAPSGKYWFGTDSNGRDVYSRVIVGLRIIIVISFLATLLGAFLGASLGLAAGYLKGKFDMVLMRILEAISAIPVIIIALLAVAAIGRSSSIITILIMASFLRQMWRALFVPQCWASQSSNMSQQQNCELKKLHIFCFEKFYQTCCRH